MTAWMAVTSTAITVFVSASPLSRGEEVRGFGWSSNYIWVSEPWPFGVIMASQLPLATYFQAWAS